jgi:hypothetical protein
MSYSVSACCLISNTNIRRGIILYLEYQSVGLFVRIAPPLTQGVCPPPLEPKGGGGGRLRGRGRGGANSDDWRERLALCILCADGAAT